MEENDAIDAKSGLPEEVLKDIAAQHATLSYAAKLINQSLKAQDEKPDNDQNFGEWVYNLEGIQNWIHHYTERKKLRCPHCKADHVFKCDNCGNGFDYHDEL